MLSIFCSTGRHFGTTVFFPTNNTDCIAAAPWCLQSPSKGQMLQKLWQFDFQSDLAKPDPVQGSLQNSLHPWDLQRLLGLLWAFPEHGRKREASIQPYRCGDQIQLTCRLCDSFHFYASFQPLQTCVATSKVATMYALGNSIIFCPP